MESNHAAAQNNWLEKTSTSISMVILGLGFATIGLVSFTTRLQGDVINGRPFENAFSMIGSTISILIGATFLIAAYFYWSRYEKQ
jgi:uncharacterized membrane protein YidH (DUF202 family)